MIKTVFCPVNGMVAVCDEHGQQIAEYQGHLRIKRAAILRDAPAEAQFYYWRFPETLNKEQFERYTEREVAPYEH